MTDDIKSEPMSLDDGPELDHNGPISSASVNASGTSTGHSTSTDDASPLGATEDQIESPEIEPELEPQTEPQTESIDQVPQTDIEGPQPQTEEVQRMKQLVQDLLKTSAQEGDFWNLIPNAYLQAFLTADAITPSDLKQHLGPVNTSILTDEAGMLFLNETETTQTVCVPPQVFQHLVEWFGIIGEPISRAIITDNTGAKVLEKFPPYFVLHGLSKTNKTSTARPTGFFMSSTKTFQELTDFIRNHYKHNGTTGTSTIRVWFLNGNLEESPANITLSQFISIPYKNLVFQNILPSTLKSQNINSMRYHLLVEPYDKSSFPVDTYIENNYSNIEDLSIDDILSTNGHLGLINLGNTCYMNSALQCLVHIPEVNYYFFFNLFQKELNKSNPLGYNGNMAETFGALLQKLFNQSSFQPLTLTSVSPREFKYTVGHFSSMFHGYQQQDSQEFLSWLLDALHEDLNRIYDKPYVEKPELSDEDIDNLAAIKKLADISWNQYKQRNDSVIIDLFSGLYQSILVCPDCSKTSITYDPFNDLTLPLPIDKKWYHTFKVVNLDFSLTTSERISTLQVELNKSSNFDDLLNYLASFLGVPKGDIFVYELFNKYFYQDFQSNANKYKFIPISEIINKNDEILIYVIPHGDEIILPVLNAVPEPDKSYNFSSLFGIPLFITVGAEEIRSFGAIRAKLERAVQVLTGVDIGDHYRQLKQLPAQDYYQKHHFQGQELGEGELDQEAGDGYDSDVSLADPEISADYGFTIKFHEDKAKSERTIHVPHMKPNINNLPELADKLPELKYNYYHHRDEKNERQDETEDQGESRDPEEFVMVENEAAPELAPVESLGPAEDLGPEPSPGSEQGSEGSDGLDAALDGSNDRLGSLFDSVGTLSRQEPATTNVTTKDPKQDNTDNHPVLVTPTTLLVLQWNPEIYSQLFQENNTWENVNEIPNPELEANRKKLLAKQKSTISLYDCLDNFYQPEVLGDQDLWYCPRCKDHKQATKTIKIWSTGDILTIHLKRFQMARSFGDKIDVTIDFPITGLDMSKYIDHQDNVYDLVAVDNHYGGLGGGHYTASALNFRDGQWYYFDDSRVSKIEDPKSTVTSAAYLLFYRKRSSEFLGGEKLNHMIREGKEEYLGLLNEQKQNIMNVREQLRAWDEAREATEGATTEGTPGTPGPASDEESISSGKKSRSPLEDDSFDKKKRLLSKPE